MRLAKTQRQHRVIQILEQNAVCNQSQLVKLLADAGVEATQATVSRDLEDIGAVKVRAAGGDSVYAVPELPKDRVAPEEHLRRVLGDWVVEVAVSANLVVLRTPPGSAHVVASALDRASLPEIVGTVAGDDTIMVVATERVGGSKLARRLGHLAGL
jgi:transcriptional regulator of arginine metabolism